MAGAGAGGGWRRGSEYRQVNQQLQMITRSSGTVRESGEMESGQTVRYTEEVASGWTLKVLLVLVDKTEKGIEQRRGREKGLPSWPKKSFLNFPAKTPRKERPLCARLWRDNLKQRRETLEYKAFQVFLRAAILS